MYKTPQPRSKFGSWDVEKVHAVVERSTFRSQKCKKHYMLGPFFFSRGRRKGLCTVPKVSKTRGFCSISKNDGRRGAFEEDLQRWFFRGSAVQETCSSELLGGPGADFLREVAFWSIRSGKIILRDKCSTSYDLASLFRGRGNTLDRWSGNIAKRIGTRPSALQSTFPVLKEASQNCFVFDVVNFENWGSLAELFCFCCCQVQKLRKSRSTVSFLDMLRSKIEEVSQNSFVLKPADRQTDRKTDRQADRQAGRQADRQTGRQIDR